MLQIILTNLLENAIKYSPSGSIVDFIVSCQGGKVIFQIKDRGIGITAADQERLFEPFYRGKNVDDLPGNGLGLAIVKNLVDIHGGQITVKSQVGVGTEFAIALPLQN
jgi:signal transduction histidine kinase